MAPGGLSPGVTLGTYRIERLLGRGGMGAVYLAYDTTLHRHVALKTLDVEAGDASARTRLVREARNAAALNHPHICTIHEVGDAGGSAFIAMEYVEGTSLRERVDAGALPLDEAVRLGIQAADALAYAHARGVVHRDFKAANAIVTDEGRLKIVDFGLARRGDAQLAGATTEMSLVPAGSAAGTPYAMAPEQVRGEPADARTDLWALGVLLYELVSGQKPFQAPTVPQLFSAILRDRPAALPSRVPLALGAVIERCLEKDPAARYPEASEVRRALETVAAGTASPWTAWKYQVRRHPFTVAAAAIVVAALVLTGANVAGLRDRVMGTPPAALPIKLAVLPFENLTGDPEQEYLSDGLTDEMITELGRLHPARLSVIARTSSMRYKGRAAPLDQIGRELNVDYVLEGSARREGSRVRINATLIRVVDQIQQWSDSFDRDLAGILSLQRDVARGVARSLALTLLPAEELRLAAARPVNPEAYEAYLRGLSHFDRGTSANLETALHYFQLALEKDPNHALSHVGTYLVWAWRRQFGFASPPDAGPPIRVALEAALALDDTLPDVHFALATEATWGDWNWTAAEPHFRRALDLNPNYADAHGFYAHYLHIMQRPEEATAHIDRAVELDPLNAVIQGMAGAASLMARRPGQALEHFAALLRLTPGAQWGLRGTANALHAAGRLDEAVAAERQLAGSDVELVDTLTRGFAEEGYRGAMRRAADTLAARAQAAHVAPDEIARLYGYAGEHELALDWMERAYEARDPNLPYISAAHTTYDAMRKAPRFQALLQRMKLPPYLKQ